MTLDRRAFLNACTSAGVASPLFPGILYALAAQAERAGDPRGASLPRITIEMLDKAAELAGVGPFTPEQKKMMLDGLNDQRSQYEKIRALNLPNSLPPAYVFHPLPAAKPSSANDDPPPAAQRLLDTDPVPSPVVAPPRRLRR